MSKRIAMTITGLLALSTTAGAVTINTKRVQPVAGGSVVCTALNSSGKAIGITAQIIDTAGGNVTDFISTDWLDEVQGILRSVRSESRNPDASYCKVTVSAGRRSDVSVLIEVFDANGQRMSFAVPR
jgi:hypothetical protein